MLSIFLTVVPMEGVFLAPLQEGRDTVLIADQMLYGVEIKDVPEGTRLYFPEIQQKSPEEGGVMVLSDWQVDTLDVKRQKKGLPRLYDIRAGFVLTSFVEGEYQLPPLSVERHSPEGKVDTLEFAPLTFNVSPVLIDTTSFQIHDIKGQIRYPVEFREVVPYLGGALLLAAVIAVSVWLTRRYIRKKSGDAASREPAHIRALRKIDRFRSDSFWAPEKQKAFYSGVTDALREYIVSRFGVPAMEMTTKEIFDGLKGKDIRPELYEEARELFERADYVKFAKYVATQDENASVLPSAVRFVTMTYQEEIDSEAEANKTREE